MGRGHHKRMFLQHEGHVDVAESAAGSATPSVSQDMHD